MEKPSWNEFIRSSNEGEKLSPADVRNLPDYVVLCYKSGAITLISINQSFKVMWPEPLLRKRYSAAQLRFILTDGSSYPGPFLREKKN